MGLATGHNWTFLSNHTHVLVVISRDPHVRVRDIAASVGITERAVQRILSELEEAGAITRQRAGRCTHYHIHQQHALHHPLEASPHRGGAPAVVG